MLLVWVFFIETKEKGGYPIRKWMQQFDDCRKY